MKTFLFFCQNFLKNRSFIKKFAILCSKFSIFNWKIMKTFFDLQPYFHEKENYRYFRKNIPFGYFSLIERRPQIKKRKFRPYRLRCPSSYKIFLLILFWWKTSSGHESHHDYVTVDYIEFNQNTSEFNLAPTHTIGPMKYKWSRVGYDLSLVWSKIT